MGLRIWQLFPLPLPVPRAGESILAVSLLKWPPLRPSWLGGRRVPCGEAMGARDAPGYRQALRSPGQSPGRWEALGAPAPLPLAQTPCLGLSVVDRHQHGCPKAGGFRPRYPHLSGVRNKASECLLGPKPTSHLTSLLPSRPQEAWQEGPQTLPGPVVTPSSSGRYARPPAALPQEKVGRRCS